MPIMINVCAQCGQTGRNADKIPHHTSKVNYVRMVLHCALSLHTLYTLSSSQPRQWNGQNGGNWVGVNFRISDYNKLLGFHAIFRQIQQMCQIDRVKSAIKILSAKKSHLFARKWTCYYKEYRARGAPDLHCLMMKHDSVVTRDTCVT